MPFKTYCLCAILLAVQGYAFAQTGQRKHPAQKLNGTIKIDGKLDEAAWKEISPLTKLVEWRPTFGVEELPEARTEIFIAYDNSAIYVGGICYERRDSISTELVGRDVIGINDYVGVIFDTYNDRINGFGFYITPLGEQFDAKYSQTSGEDGSWNAVWNSDTRITSEGWTFEMRIPYSALRFVSKDQQTWGLNVTRNRKKIGRQYMWNPVDPKVNGFMNQEGEWTGIQKIDAPVRLSFSPYLSAYLNHFPSDNSEVKDLKGSVNGGMDVKYGINDAFTLDMTLIPDFGQVQSDNQVLNLTPFEVQYNENRAFFTEGTELFNKGNLFYSRRVGGTPYNFGDAYAGIGATEFVKENPTESKLLNATKISGRTARGLGIGFFNAITKPMYATIRDSVSKAEREVKTGPLTNYNIVVVDQSLKNNSSVSFINTNTLRSGATPDGNVSAALYNINNKKNTYNVNGKFALSQIISGGKNSVGYSHLWSVGKTGGRWNFALTEELADNKYDINDMGILFNNNYVDHYFWTAYRWIKPRGWYNRIQINYNFNHSRLFKKLPNQVIESMMQSINTNFNGNVQFKNLWWAGFYLGYTTRGNDFYEPRKEGRSFRSSRRIQINPWIETNGTKKYYVSLNYFVGLRSIFNSPNHELNVQQRYRFSDKFSVTHNVLYNPTTNDAGYYRARTLDGNFIPTDDPVFTRRDRKTVENIFSIKYSFNNKSGLTFRARHYWSKVIQKELYDLTAAGELVSSKYASVVPLINQNFNVFNIDAVYTLQFAPGSFINIVWKDQSLLDDQILANRTYGKNLERTLTEPQQNNLSIKIIYFLDYLDLKKGKRSK